MRPTVDCLFVFSPKHNYVPRNSSEIKLGLKVNSLLVSQKSSSTLYRKKEKIVATEATDRNERKVVATAKLTC